MADKKTRDAQDEVMIEKIARELESKPLPEFETHRSNRDRERNRVIIACIEAGIPTTLLAEYFGVSRQRISEIWKRFGDGYNLRARRDRITRQGRFR